MKKMQEDMKRQTDKGRKESEVWKKSNRVLLSTKDLVFKEKLVRKLVDRYISPYMIEEVVSTNVGQIATTNLNENPSGCKHQLYSTI